MTGTTPPHRHPLGPDAPTEDHVGRAFGGLAMGVAVGTGLASLVGFVVRTLQAGSPPPATLDLSNPPAAILLFGTLFALAVAALVTWRVMAPARSPYRQGILSMVSAFATVVVSLITMPVDRAFGRGGLLALSVLTFGLAYLVSRRVAGPGTR